ncbi:GLE1-domain-containing protein [Aureobasidium pullulans]|uniref:mRNA export factor GLE1 n=1 Tax=Aureobasidium pullulans TaxID=5580 RepID=A0A4V4JWE4_AURPU|nr:GLE1-domain-containing protein [Aureobasidium pullulans]
MATPRRERAGTASPASQTPRSNVYVQSKRSHNSPYRHSPRRSEVLAEEFGTLHINEERAWRQQQDERDAEQERLHQQALAQAAAEHERILRNAIETAEIEALKLERERKQKEEEAHRALEAERSAKAAREAADRQRRKDELERQEQEQLKRAAEEKELQERQARLAEQRQKDEADALRRKQEKESSDRKAKEEADAAAAAAAAATKAAAQPAQAPVNGQSQAQPPQVQPAQTLATQPSIAPTTQPVAQPSIQAASTTPSTATTTAAAASPLKSTPTQLEALHKQYLTIHKRLKEVRRKTLQQCKKNPSYGITDIGDYRRKLNMLMGQFTVDKVSNRAVVKKILELLVKLRQFTEPSIDITPLLAIPPDNVERRMPAPFVYLLNLVAKNALKQFCNDNVVVVDAVAILVATVFSKTEFLFNDTTSLLDILLAKYHMVCPVLFGIYGDETTRQGRARVGWQLVDDSYIDAELHKVRMTGLAIGYGCLSLRDFSKSKMQNPFPPTNYWRALSYFANTPPAQLQPTHFIVLRALVETHVEKFLKYYGHAGIVALRRVLVELPKNAPKSAAKETVEVLPRTLQARIHLTL